MRGIAYRSVGLSRETRQAWNAVDVQFARRERTSREVLTMPDYDIVINLGASYFEGGGDNRVWNDGVNIKPLIWPGTARELFDDLMPVQPSEFPADVWIKAPGRGGRGKYMKSVDRSLVLPAEWDWQKHVEGIEYRVITVHDKVVQDFIRSGPNGDREYTWTPMAEVPRIVKRLARKAARRLDGYNVIAWDLISDGQTAYLLEGNSCPGMSEPTAQRIKRTMEEIQYARTT